MRAKFDGLFFCLCVPRYLAYADALYEIMPKCLYHFLQMLSISGLIRFHDKVQGDHELS
jgi:hypothetical protein